MIKSISIVVASAAMLAVGGCATNRVSSPSSAAVQMPVMDKHLVGPNNEINSETITYHWNSVGVDVTFSKDDNDTNWDIYVGDGWSIYGRPAETVWGPSVSMCSKDQCLELLDQSLTKFHAEKPGARFGSVSLEMQLVRELWGEILAALKQKLSTLSSKVTFEPCYSPDEVYETLQHAIDQSATVSEVHALLKKHGLVAPDTFVGSTLCFKISLGGQRWSEIASLPDSGVGLPGVVEFDFDASSAGRAVNETAPRPDDYAAYRDTILAIKQKAGDLVAADDLFSDTNFIAFYEHPLDCASNAVLFLKTAENSETAQTNNALGDADFAKMIVVYSLQRLPLRQYVEFEGQLVDMAESRQISSNLFKRAIFPGIEWSTKIQINYSKPQTKSLLSRMSKCGELDSDNKKYLKEIAKGKAREHIQEMEEAGMVPPPCWSIIDRI